MGTEQTNVLIVMVTVPNIEEATRIAERAVQSRHAACATTIPSVHSMYWWEGKVARDREAMVLLKTTADKFPALQESIQKVHSYKVPEIIGIPVSQGLPQYLEWVRNETA